MIDSSELRLVIYGDGPYAEELKLASIEDSRIEYRGLASNEVVLEEEINATLLVNPRPTNQDFTKYSFPSKNLEYMLSGTPVLTTNLPGMPKEYKDYVFLFEEETVEGFAKSITEIMNMPRQALLKKGKLAQDFVIREKNKKRQAERIKLFFQEDL